MSEVVCTQSRGDCEDDFEKDLDWLISADQGTDDEDIEAEIDKELGEDEKLRDGRKMAKSHKSETRGNKTEESDEDEERWPSPMEPVEFDSDRDSPNKSPAVVPPPPERDEQTDEEKKHVLEKIQQANRELQGQEAPDLTRRRRLHFKDRLVDLLVPPLELEKGGSSGEADGGKGSRDRAKHSEAETEVSGKLSELKLSPREESGSAGEGSEGGQRVKEGRVLVEKDGKFDLVSLNEVENQGLLPPIPGNMGDCSRPSPRPQEQTSSRIPRSSSCSRAGFSHLQQGVDHLRVPRPPAQPRSRPSSASHNPRGSHRIGVKRRVQSATGTTCQATYTMSPQQKELLQRSQERKEKLAKEAEHRKHEEEEQKKQDNELAFKAWLMKKREQCQEEKRVHRAQEMERLNSKRDPSDPQESFRLWLQRKQEQQQRERQLVELRRLEQDSGYLLRSREECERAFKMWLRRKRVEKRAEQQAAREQSRRLVLEERRARRMRDLLCAVNDTRPLRFNEQLAYRF